jgi:hypothetical protein
MGKRGPRCSDPSYILLNTSWTSVFSFMPLTLCLWGQTTPPPRFPLERRLRGPRTSLIDMEKGIFYHPKRTRISALWLFSLQPVAALHVLSTTKHKSEQIHKDGRVRIFKAINDCLHEILFPIPAIILIILFCK